LELFLHAARFKEHTRYPLDGQMKNIKLFQVKLSHALKKKRGFAGIDAAIMIAFLLGMMFVLAVTVPGIVQWFANTLLGGANGAYSLLIELPVLSSNRPSGNASPAQWVGNVADNLHTLMMNISLSLFAVVLVIAGICYALESFRIMGEGTATNIITNSVFTFILIFAAKPVYNLVATAINVFTGWPDVGGSGLIIQGGGEIDSLISAMGGGLLGEDIGQVAVRFFGSIVIFILCVSIIMLCIMMGAVRLLLIGCLAGMLPLILVLRLIPPVRHLADSLVEAVIGISFASVMSAIFIHFGAALIGTGLSGLTKLVIALATLSACAYMSTMFAGRLGGMFTSMATMASMASSTATGLMMGGIMTVTGAGVGGLSSAVQTAGLGASRKGIATAALKGAGLGAARMAAATLPGAVTGKGAGGVLTAGVGAAPSVSSDVADLVSARASDMAEAGVLSVATQDIHPLARDAALVKRFNEEEYPKLVREGKLFEAYFPKDAYPELHKYADKAAVEARLRDVLDRATPEMRYSAFTRMAEAGAEVRSMSSVGRVKSLLSGTERLPELRAKLDNIARGVEKPPPPVKPGIYDAVATFHVGGAGRTAMARFFQDLRESESTWTARATLAEDLERAQPLLEYANDPNKYAHLGDLVENYTGTKLSESEKFAVGQRMAWAVRTAKENNPYLLANMSERLLSPSKETLEKMEDAAFTQRALNSAHPDRMETQAWLANKLRLKPEAVEREVGLGQLFQQGGSPPPSPPQPPSTPPQPSTPPPRAPPQTPPPAQPVTRLAPQPAKAPTPQLEEGQPPPVLQPPPPQQAPQRRKKGVVYDFRELQRRALEGKALPPEVNEAFHQAMEKVEDKA
jgi:hypothetical protein